MGFVRIGEAVIEYEQISAIVPARDCPSRAQKLLVFLKSGQTITLTAQDCPRDLLELVQNEEKER